MKRVCTPVAAHRRILSKGVIDKYPGCHNSQISSRSSMKLIFKCRGMVLTSLKLNQQSSPSCPNLMLFERNRALH